MPKKITREIRSRLRISCGKNIALGPGKVELLELLHETGPITLAAKRIYPPWSAGFAPSGLM